MIKCDKVSSKSIRLPETTPIELSPNPLIILILNPPRLLNMATTHDSEAILLPVAGTPVVLGSTASNMVAIKNLPAVVPNDMHKSNYVAAETNNTSKQSVVSALALSLQYRVKARIIHEKLTQNKLCKRLGIGVSSLSRWLNGLTAKMNPAYLIQMDEM